MTRSIDIQSSQARSGRLSAEQRATDAEVLLRHHVEAALLLDVSGRILALNEAAAARLGKPASELPGRSLLDLLPAVVRPTVRSRLDEAVRLQKTIRFEEDGTGRVYEYCCCPVASPNGEVASVALYIGEVTQRVLAQEASRDSESRYRAMVDNRTEVICRLLPDGTLTFVNDAYVRCFGQTREELIGQDYYSLLFAEDREKVRQRFASLGRDHPVAVYEHRFPTARDQVCLLQWTSRALFDSDGRLGEYLLVGRDLTKQKRAEEALRVSRKESAIRNEIASIFLIVSNEDMYAEVLGVLLQAFQSRYGYFGFIDQSGNLVCPSMTRDIFDACRMEEKDLVFPRESWGGLWGRSLEEKQTLYQNDALEVPGGHIPLRRVLLAPIVHQGELIGQFAVADKPSDYTEEDSRLLENLAAHVAPVLHARIENERLERQREEAEQQLRLSHHFLETANRHCEMQPLLDGFVAALKKFADCEAVGIRILREHGAIPYQAFDGFSQEFFEQESPLSIETDRCMCIKVIKGETNTGLPYFTQEGSFHVNGTSRFLANISEEEKGQTRNACNQYGFESVVLVPIQMGKQILGLIHLADSREDVFSDSLVRVLEKAAMQLGTAIQRIHAEEAVRTAKDQLEVRVRERTSELAQTNEALEAEIAHRERLENEVLNIGAREQQRIGQELHDELGQELTGLGYLAKSLHQRLDSQELSEAEMAAEVAQGIPLALRRVQGIVKNLVPPEIGDGQLVQALQTLASNVEDRAGISCCVESDQPEVFCDTHRAIHLYRIAQEAANNAVKHGQARNIVVELETDRQRIILRVRDDGIGFSGEDDRPSGFGLRIMRYRARICGGQLDVQSSADEGTLVTCTIDREQSND